MKIKPSELPKDGNFSGRINKEMKELLKKKGVTIQKIVDEKIDEIIGELNLIEND